MSLRFLFDHEWRLLRDVRLAALRDCPDSFLSSLEAEERYGEGDWREEVARGHWLVHCARGEPAAVLGATPGDDIPPDERYLSYLWVTPDARRSGLGATLVTAMLDRLHDAGVPRAWLWVLDGNEAAHSLYRKLGFVSSGLQQPLTGRPGRSEERLTRRITAPRAGRVSPGSTAAT